jgi:hypothetical protein
MCALRNGLPAPSAATSRKFVRVVTVMVLRARVSQLNLCARMRRRMR